MTILLSLLLALAPIVTNGISGGGPSLTTNGISGGGPSAPIRDGISGGGPSAHNR